MLCMECGAKAEKGITTDVVKHLELISRTGKNDAGNFYRGLQRSGIRRRKILA
jgi:hypothetical protein